MSPTHEPKKPKQSLVAAVRESAAHTRRTLALVWASSRPMTIALGALTGIGALVPLGVAYAGKRIVDAVVARSRDDAFRWVIVELVLVVVMAMVQRGLGLVRSLLGARLGIDINVTILEKALGLDLRFFEDSEFYDKLTRARREASTRPLSLVTRTFGLGQNAISLISYGTLLFHFSPWAVLVLLLAGLPSFISETKFSGDAFRLFRWRSPETRMQLYLETVLAREDHAKEVKLYGLGPLLLDRYRDIFNRLYRDDRNLTFVATAGVSDWVCSAR